VAGVGTSLRTSASRTDSKVPVLFAGTDVIEFCPTTELQHTLEVVEKNMGAAGQEGDEGRLSAPRRSGESTNFPPKRLQVTGFGGDISGASPDGRRTAVPAAIPYRKQPTWPEQ
jgi:hypothetical protein